MKEKMQSNSSAVRFRRFTGASFAVFRSLSTPVTIGVLAVNMLTFANATTVQAQTQPQTPEKQIALEEVEVLGSRTPLTVSQAARIVTVIDRKEIAAAPVHTVNDLLKYAVGVDVRQRGDMGIQTDISIRGGTADQITILLNGVNISDPQTGHNAVDFPVDISQIERIEVLEGPAGRVYGTSSLLGAINIVTREATDNHLTAHAEGGSYGFATAGAALHLSHNRLYNSFSGSYTRSDGFSRSTTGNLNSDFKVGKVFYQGGYHPSDVLKLNWFAGYSQKDFGANTFYSAKFDNQFEQTKKIFTALQAETAVDFFRLKTSVYWNRSYDRFEMVRGSNPSYHRTDVTGADVNAFFTSFLGKTALGFDVRNEGIISTFIGEPLTDSHPISGTELAYKNGVNRTIVNAVFEHNIVLRRFTLSAGVVAGMNAYDQKGFHFYPGVDASYQFARDWKVYASYNTSSRYPNFTEMFYKYKGYQPDKYLKSERMEAFELGLKYLTPAVRATLSGYYHKGRNMIDWVKDASKGPDADWVAVNHLNLNSKGVETSLVLDVNQLLPKQHFFRQLSLSYNYISQDKEATPDLVSKYALEYLKHKLVAQAHFHVFSRLNWNMAYRWQERKGNYTDVQGKAHAYEPYGLLDTRLSWDSPAYAVYFEANNLLNKTYYDYGNIPQPGFWFRLGGSYTFRL